MIEATSREFNCGAVMRYSRRLGPESQVVMHKEHGVYHVRMWVNVDSCTPSTLKRANWIVIDGPYAHVRAIKTFRLMKRAIDAMADLKFMGCEL